MPPAPRVLNAADALSALPPFPTGPFRSRIATRLTQSPPLPTLVILDDDPTGTQTCHNITVLTVWDIPTLTNEFALSKSSGGFFILTNSRALHTDDARSLIRTICNNLSAAAAQVGASFEVVLRSDSTLRGHFPAEPEVVDEVLGKSDLWILAPFFFQGGRWTIDDVHYVKEGEELVPVGETPFAKDATFGFKASDLREWVVEKTKGGIKREEMGSIGIGDLRREGGYEYVTQLLLKYVHQGVKVVVINAAAEEDMGIAVLGIMYAAADFGKKFVFRTGAAFVSTRLGIESIPPLTAEQLGIDRVKNAMGGLIVTGSYVPKTTAQLQRLIDRRGDKLQTVTLQVKDLLESAAHSAQVIETAIAKAEQHLQAGEDVLVMTSRDLIKGRDERESLQIGSTVAAALRKFVNGLRVRPRYVIGKGGITSSDLATDWLKMKRATIVGQAAAGVPIWKCEEEEPSKPDLLVIWPGNVGGDDTLCDVVEKWYG